MGDVPALQMGYVAAQAGYVAARSRRKLRACATSLRRLIGWMKSSFALMCASSFSCGGGRNHTRRVAKGAGGAGGGGGGVGWECGALTGWASAVGAVLSFGR
eukprot:6198388-Pleurochrysis_carterae.AAC.4